MKKKLWRFPGIDFCRHEQFAPAALCDLAPISPAYNRLDDDGRELLPLVAGGRFGEPLPRREGLGGHGEVSHLVEHKLERRSEVAQRGLVGRATVDGGRGHCHA